MSRWWAYSALVASVPGCLPGDTRPEPATFEVDVAASEATQQGFTTDDGWTVTFERFLAGVGQVDLDGDPDGEETSCNAYSDARYDRLFDFVVAGPHKLGLVYGLGTCSVEYRVRSPSDDSILGPGATTEDLAFMRVEASDAYAEEERTSVYVVGTATKDDETKAFAWVFRRSHEMDRCEAEDGGYVSVVDASGGETLAFRVVIHGEELFRVGPSDEAPFQFDLYASADVDGDGEITLEELGAVAAPPQEPWEDPDDDGDDDDPPPPDLEPPTLADVLYRDLLPRISRMQGGGPCEADLRD